MNTELVVVVDAVHEIASCTDLPGTFGRTMPTADNLVGALTSAAGWSTFRAKTLAFDDYCRTQEGLAWIAARGLLAKAQPLVLQAAANDPSIAAEFPSLVQFLSARSVTAQRAASSRRANREAVAKGAMPTRGTKAKARLRAAQRSALAQAPTTIANPAPAASPTEPAVTSGTTNGVPHT